MGLEINGERGQQLSRVETKRQSALRSNEGSEMNVDQVSRAKEKRPISNGPLISKTSLILKGARYQNIELGRNSSTLLGKRSSTEGAGSLKIGETKTAKEIVIGFKRRKKVEQKGATGGDSAG